MEDIWMKLEAVFDSGIIPVPIHSHRRRRPTTHPRYRSIRHHKTMVTTRSASSSKDTPKSTTTTTTTKSTKKKSLYIPSEFKAPLLSPQSWMDLDFIIENLSVREIRTILEVCSITDDYCRKFQQIQIFKDKVLPKVLIVRERYSNDISQVSDEELIESFLSIEPLVGEKRRFEEDLSDDESIDSNLSSDSRPTKKLKVSKY
ncbi:uncharacterized protein MELLADRAFT_101211 [Melampsora larici-populina 98AG31]|uniref:Uncharacterized protein n=1 Tax=Melampsora larici-populina (strain 98AG31 / pathotype 3-4-7) TaxID=747676 RepID=F4R3Z9_MELLP|nr:uncharacterized protein MELLADRAFT_101211 [Melampsora larici-populina 98AG31]EGG12712.1 hypothetical protein MELLADRAFT_101211 [Melampsora larici-populina 98AG31]